MEDCSATGRFIAELLSRTSLETQKLNLMTEVSELKLKLVGMEKEQKEQEEKQKKAEPLGYLVDVSSTIIHHITQSLTPRLLYLHPVGSECDQ
ncbi:hypothetical protein Celaphus_00009109 [Cervus elaphus hippelaphus]|uniref:Liprin-beta-1/2 coiled-coil domain-containing protein n=1 Tax=Cervus elaphus hippelaphus TaxID=46360 RepID=A0A212DIH7_CEREH|nr:hypothetical protein Celaphus_00009109 [Cervus elaphus hippelaphus]